jgi:hypothetical protein
MRLKMRPGAARFEKNAPFSDNDENNFFAGPSPELRISEKDSVDLSQPRFLFGRILLAVLVLTAGSSGLKA